MKTITHVGIIGAGTMGAALTQKFAQEGLIVFMVDRDDRFLDRGMENIRVILQEGVKRRIFTEEQMRQIVDRIHPTIDMNELAQCQVVIEAVFEDKKVKEDLFNQISEIVPSDTILATNTSSFSVTELAESVKHPQRFLGLHFFYHAAKNRLVEVVRGETTSDAIFNECMWFMQRCGKDPIFCKDSHGFVVNRFFVPWLNEAVHLYEESIAEPAAIDTIARKAFGCGMGPFALMNATGVPIAYHSQRTLEDAFGEFYHPAETLKLQTEKNEEWSISGSEEVEPSVAKQISDRLLAVTLFVCGQLLDEKVCTAGDISRGAGIGLKWRKGPVDCYHKLGEAKVSDLVRDLAKEWKLDVPGAMASEHWKPDFVNTEINGHTGVITINRPEGMNAMNPTVVSQLADAFDRLDGDDSLKNIVITARGKAFVAGADINFFIDHIKANTISEIVDFTTDGQKLFTRIDESDKKIIVMVNGFALGGGLELALTADVIVALNKAIFAFPETGIGIYPGLGGTQRPINRIGKGLTKYLVYSGQILSAQKAAEIGLIDNVVSWDEMVSLIADPDSLEKNSVTLSEKWQKLSDYFNNTTVEALFNMNEIPEGMEKIIGKIRTKAPVAMKIVETLINENLGPESELDHLETIFNTADALAGLQSVGKRPPEYKGC
jgi:enoyl-CoA hydratase/3-hydroxyacyl-CoA dehydrogenase